MDAEAKTVFLDIPDRNIPDRNLGASRIRPHDAATLIILDRTKRSPKILMGRRSQRHVFMPGLFVFPGGRMEPCDRRMPVAGALHPRIEQALATRVSRPPLQHGRALALAALRETYEETGLMIGTVEYGPPDSVPEDPSWQAFRDQGIFPDLERLHFVARAITPPGRPRRFDTRFFAVDRDAIAYEAPGIIGPEAEFSELDWVTFPQTQTMELPFITRVVLEELEARIAAGLSPELPVPFFRPQGKRLIREMI